MIYRRPISPVVPDPQSLTEKTKNRERTEKQPAPIDRSIHTRSGALAAIERTQTTSPIAKNPQNFWINEKKANGLHFFSMSQNSEGMVNPFDVFSLLKKMLTRELFLKKISYL